MEDHLQGRYGEISELPFQDRPKVFRKGCCRYTLSREPSSTTATARFCYTRESIPRILLPTTHTKLICPALIQKSFN